METNPRLRLGYAISALAILFLAFDATIKLLNISAVGDSFRTLGFQRNLGLELGLLQLALLILYLVPRTAILGAVLWTGYLGGAMAIHLRMDAPLLSHTLFPLFVAIPLWAGLWIRDARLRGTLAALPAASAAVSDGRSAAFESLSR